MNVCSQQGIYRYCFGAGAFSHPRTQKTHPPVHLFCQQLLPAIEDSLPREQHSVDRDWPSDVLSGWGSKSLEAAAMASSTIYNTHVERNLLVYMKRYLQYVVQSERFCAAFQSLPRKHYHAVFECMVDAFLNRETVDQTSRFVETNLLIYVQRYIHYLLKTDRFSSVFERLPRKDYNAVFNCTVDALVNRETIDSVVARRPSVQVLRVEDSVWQLAGECLQHVREIVPEDLDLKKQRKAMYHILSAVEQHAIELQERFRNGGSQTVLRLISTVPLPRHLLQIEERIFFCQLPPLGTCLDPRIRLLASSLEFLPL